MAATAEFLAVRHHYCSIKPPKVADVPVAAYQVSGEYAVIETAAGARMTLTYWATEVVQRLGR